MCLRYNRKHKFVGQFVYNMNILFHPPCFADSNHVGKRRRTVSRPVQLCFILIWGYVARFEVIKVALLNFLDFLDMTPCWLINGNKLLEECTASIFRVQMVPMEYSNERVTCLLVRGWTGKLARGKHCTHCSTGVWKTCALTGVLNVRSSGQLFLK